jgi:hypothetical protein
MTSASVTLIRMLAFVMTDALPHRMFILPLSDPR